MENSLNTGSVATTGTTTDIICNVYDMASNCSEWSTETCNRGTEPVVMLGGNYYYGNYCTSNRNFTGAWEGYGTNFFRPLLYIGL